jgi:starch synthase
MKVLFAITEADPFIKTGGLGEVGGSLPFALQQQGVEVRVILPKYSLIPECFRSQMKLIRSFMVPLAWRQQYCGLEELYFEGIHYYFIDNEYYFERSNPYGDQDEAEKYAFFSRAVLESIRYLPEFKPDIIHCNDWHTALIALFRREFYANDPLYYNIKTLLTIHNLKYQGVFAKVVLEDVLGLGEEFFTPENLEFHGAVNFMKAGLIYADQVSTVSPTYAEEIQFPFYGEGLEGIFKKRKGHLIGIINGIAESKYIAKLEEKESNKSKLQRDLGLSQRSDVPILCLVSRFVDQKGLDLLACILEEILELDVQMVVLGTGEKEYEEMFRQYAHRYSNKFVVRINFSDELARIIYAGSDIFLMPSRFEPCGIAQMIAMRYGTIPVVRETGGLKDTVSSYSETTGEGNGFSFKNYNAHDFLFTVQRAVKLYNENKPVWKNLQNNALQSDFSWTQSALKYMQVYENLYYTPT